MIQLGATHGVLVSIKLTSRGTVVRHILARLHSDERGDAVQFILIAAAVAIPLIIGLVYFGSDIMEFLGGRTEPVGEDVIERPETGLGG